VEVGIRALRDGLSRYLGRVRDGHPITVTDRGRPIARITPVGSPTTLERLIAEGRVRRATSPRSTPEPGRATGKVSDLLTELDPKPISDTHPAIRP
jgi:prevent-host-death family protein